MRDIYSEITQTIIDGIENTTGEFKLPWHSTSGGGLPQNIVSKKAYQGGNCIFLMVVGFKFGYSTSNWGTYKQWQGLGGQVKRGSKSAPIFVPMAFKREDEEDTYLRFRARYVFNQDQVEGLEPEEVATDAAADPITPHDRAEALIKASEATIKIGGERAFYALRDDTITMPDRERFIGSETMTATEGWYSTLLHELVHWTGAEHRLGRFDRGANRTKADYAFEELVAEFGAAFLCAKIGVTNALRDDHQQYLKHWVSLLKEDNKALFRAASAAEKAASYLTNLAPAQSEQAA